MEIKLNEEYLMMANVSYGMERASIINPFDGSGINFYTTHTHSVVQFKKFEKINDIFSKYYFTSQYDRPQQEDKYLLICYDNEFFQKIPMILLLETYTKDVRKVYHVDQLQHIVYRPSEKFIKLKEHISNIIDNHQNIMKIMNNMLRDEATDSKADSIERDAYDHGVLNYLESNNKTNERHKNTDGESSNTSVAGLSESI